MSFATKQDEQVPMNAEIKGKIDDLGRAVAQFKDDVPAYFEQKAKGYIDPLLAQVVNAKNEAVTIAEDAKKTAEDAYLAVKRFSTNGISANEAEAQYIKQQRSELVTGFRELAKANPGIKGLDSIEMFQKAYSTGSDPDGGILVRPYLDNTILKLMLEMTPFRQYARSVTISTDTYRQVASIDNEDVSWIDDHNTPPDNSPNTYKDLEINVKDLAVNIPIPQNLLADAFFDLETEIMQQAARKMAKAESQAFIYGDGVAKPRGILTYPAGDGWGMIEQIPSLSADSLTYEGLMDLVYSLLSFYTQNAVFMMNRTTIKEVRLLTYGSNFPVPMWQPSLIPGQPSTLSGFPVVYAPDMPTFAASAKAIAFGDFSKAYLIVDRLGMQVLRDPLTAYPKVKFRFLKRVGGGLADYRAVKIQTISAS
jgi:HK97 family phage major capsid protein